MRRSIDGSELFIQMKQYLHAFKQFLAEAEDPTYYQETFAFTVLISMSKDRGGSRDETKNDIRALPEILTVTLVEPEKGGIQRDIGTKYLSTLKLHVRRPRDINKKSLMRRIVLHVNNLRGVTVLRYKEKKPKPRKKVFHGPGSYKINEGDYYQSAEHKSDLKADFKELTTKSGKKKGKGGEPFDQDHNLDSDWEQAPPGAPGGLEEEIPAADPLYEDILIALGGGPDDLLAFDVQDTLNQKLWDKEVAFRPGVKGAILDIVEEFMESLDLDIEVKDIIITGSIANYNWSKFSDIDVHVLVDFAEVNDNKDMVKRFFDAVRSNWNKLHNIFVKGHEVEIYIQDMDEPHISTGVFSLMEDQWRVKPKKIKPFVDKETAMKKMEYLTREIDKLVATRDKGLYEKAYKEAQRLKDKIKRMRQSGLQKTGIYSPENLAFKMLRRSGAIEELFAVYTQAYDKIHSMDQ